MNKTNIYLSFTFYIILRYNIITLSHIYIYICIYQKKDKCIDIYYIFFFDIYCDKFDNIIMISYILQIFLYFEKIKYF